MAKSSFFSDTGVSTTNTNAIENSVDAAAASATAASTSATEAAASATQATANIAANQASAAASEASKVSSVAAQAAAEAAQAASLVSENNAATSATSSEASKVTSVASQVAAAASATSAASSATSAATSASTATTKAAAASISQAAAATSAADAQSYASSSLPLSGGNLTGNLGLPVNAKIILGSSPSSSLQVYNDGANSIITESSSGSLLLRGNNLYLQDASNNNYAQAISGGAVTLYDNTGGSPSAKIATTSFGASISGNIVVTGTVDGRDVATDGTKLDGIAVSANNYSHPSAHAISFITGLQTALDGKVDDSQVLTNVPSGALFTDTNTTYSVGDGGLTQNNFTDADHSKLNAIEASATADQTDAEIKTAYESNSDTNAFTDADHTKLDGIAASANNYVLPSGYATETYVNTQVTNLVDSSPATLDTLNELAAALGDDPNFATTTATSIGTKASLSGAVFTGEITANGGIALGDNDKATFGASDDLQIYHDGTNSYIKDDGNGDLIIQAYDDIKFQQSTDNADLVTINTGGNVTIHGGNLGVTGTVTATGTSVFASLDISGDIDVDGTTNLDVVDIDGAVDMASTLAVAGVVTANAGVVVDNITIDGNEIDVSSGDLTLDVAGDIILDADGGDIFLKDGGTQFLNLKSDNTSAEIKTAGNLTLDADAGTVFVKDGGTTSFSFIQGTNSEIDVPRGDLTLDVAGNTVINSDAGGVYFLDGAVTYATMLSTGAVFNEAGADADFRVESDGNANMLFVDGGNNRVGIGRVPSISNSKLEVGGADNVSLINVEASGVTGGIGIGSTGLQFFHGSSSKMTINSSGNVGIGTSSPRNDTNFKTLQIGDSSTAASQLVLDDNDSNGPWRIISNLSLIINDDATERMRIDSSGNLLVGTTSTGINTSSSVKGHNFFEHGYVVHARSGQTVMSLNRQTNSGTILDFRLAGSVVGSIGTLSNDLYLGTGNTTLTFTDGSRDIVPTGTDGAQDGDVISLGNANNRFKNLYLSANASFGAHLSPHGDNTYVNMLGSNRIQFLTNGQEAARIDSSQNLLVGKTAANFTVAGHEIKPNGFAGFTRDGGSPVIVNRLTNDGDLIEFYRGTQSVGSIGTLSGLMYIGNGDCNLLFTGASDAILPVGTNGATKDGQLDLGSSGNRFKDLYLSGGVVFGTTGGSVSSKTLDDYEEGTFSPALSATGYTFSYTGQNGSYVKVGNMVSVKIYIRPNAQPSGSGTTALHINGLPFVSSNVTSSYAGGGIIVEGSDNLFSGVPGIRSNQNAAFLTIFNVRAGNSPQATFDCARIDAVDEFEISMVYHV